MSSVPTLGEFEQLVLLAVMRLGDAAYGMTVRREITERARRDVSIGAVYATLDRLESKRLVRSREAGTIAERGGRGRRLFAITALGLRALRAAQDAFARMREGLEPGLGPA